MFAPTGIGDFCNAACRQQFYRRPGFTKTTWEAMLREKTRIFREMVSEYEWEAGMRVLGQRAKRKCCKRHQWQEFALVSSGTQ